MAIKHIICIIYGFLGIYRVFFRLYTHTQVVFQTRKKTAHTHILICMFHVYRQTDKVFEMEKMRTFSLLWKSKYLCYFTISVEICGISRQIVWIFVMWDFFLFSFVQIFLDEILFFLSFENLLTIEWFGKFFSWKSIISFFCESDTFRYKRKKHQNETNLWNESFQFEENFQAPHSTLYIYFIQMRFLYCSLFVVVEVEIDQFFFHIQTLKLH